MDLICNLAVQLQHWSPSWNWESLHHCHESIKLQSAVTVVAVCKSNIENININNKYINISKVIVYCKYCR